LWEGGETLKSTGEADKVESNAKTSTVSGRSTNRRNEDIQHTECGGSHQSNDDNFFSLERLGFRDGVSGNSNDKTLNDVLDSSSDEFIEIENTTHLYNTETKNIVKQSIFS
jgi:hypothetical protein